MSHSQTDALGNNGPLQKDGVSLVSRIARQNLMGQLIYAVIVTAFVGQLRHLRENPLANIRNAAVNVSHGHTSLVNRVFSQ